MLYIAFSLRYVGLVHTVTAERLYGLWTTFNGRLINTRIAPIQNTCLLTGDAHPSTLLAVKIYRLQKAVNVLNGLVNT